VRRCLKILRRPGSPWFWTFWPTTFVVVGLAVLMSWPGLRFNWIWLKPFGLDRSDGMTVAIGIRRQVYPNEKGGETERRIVFGGLADLFCQTNGDLPGTGFVWNRSPYPQIGYSGDYLLVCITWKGFN
jgi:hypothetical protein